MAEIKLTNSVQINHESCCVFPDYSNVLVDNAGGTGVSWQATQDCFVTIFGYSMNPNVTIGGNKPFHQSSGLYTYGGSLVGPFFVKSGETIAFTSPNSQGGQGLKAFGLK